MLPLTLFPVGVIVLALAACGLSATSTPPLAGSGVDISGLRCALTITERGGQLQIEGELRAVAAATGRYALAIRQTGQNQVFIDQSGDFTAIAGETVTVGSASLSGSTAQYDATLTLDFADATVTCPVTIATR